MENIQADHWERCLHSWKKLQVAASKCRCAVHSSVSDSACEITKTELTADDCKVDGDFHGKLDDGASKLAVKRPLPDSVTFRVSAKCAGGVSTFNSQVLFILLQLPIVSHIFYSSILRERCIVLSFNKMILWHEMGF